MTADEIKIRLTAFWVLLLAASFALLPGIVIPIILVVDFALRSFKLGKWSPLFRLSSAIATLLHWSGKPVYLPAKQFAARIGLLVSIGILAFSFAGSPVATGLALLLAVFAALESLLGFCAGCYVYDLVKSFAN